MDNKLLEKFNQNSYNKLMRKKKPKNIGRIKRLFHEGEWQFFKAVMIWMMSIKGSTKP